VHEGVEGVVKGVHEVGVVDWRLSACELRSEALVPVCEDVLVLVMVPLLEHVADVQIPGEVRSAILGNVENIVGLEVDLLVGVLQSLVPRNPLGPVRFHSFLIRQGTHLALYQLDNPESADLEHCVSVVPARFYLETNLL